MPQSPEQKIMELEAQVKLLEKQQSFLEQQSFVAHKKAIIFDLIIDNRKNSPDEQSTILKNNNNKQ